MGTFLMLPRRSRLSGFCLSRESSRSPQKLISACWTSWPLLVKGCASSSAIGLLKASVQSRLSTPSSWSYWETVRSSSARASEDPPSSPSIWASSAFRLARLYYRESVSFYFDSALASRFRR